MNNVGSPAVGSGLWRSGWICPGKGGSDGADSIPRECGRCRFQCGCDGILMNPWCRGGGLVRENDIRSGFQIDQSPAELVVGAWVPEVVCRMDEEGFE